MNKRILISFLLLLTLFVSIGCSTDSSNNSNDKKSDISTKGNKGKKDDEETESLINLQEEAKIGDLSVIITGIEYTNQISDGSFVITADEGNTYVMLQMAVKNSGNQDVELGNMFTDSLGMYMQLDIDGNKFTPSSSMLSNDLVSSIVKPLSKVAGIRYFEVSEDIVKELKSINIRIEREKGSKEYCTVKLPTIKEAADQVKKVAVGDKFVINNFKCVVSKFEFVNEISDGMWKIDVEDSEKIGQLWLRVTNESQEKSFIDSYDSSVNITLVYKDEYKYSFNTSLSMEKDLSNISIAPLKEVEGFTYFVVPDVVATDESGSVYIEIKNINDIQEKYILKIR